MLQGASGSGVIDGKVQETAERLMDRMTDPWCHGMMPASSVKESNSEKLEKVGNGVDRSTLHDTQ